MTAFLQSMVKRPKRLARNLLFLVLVASCTFFVMILVSSAWSLFTSSTAVASTTATTGDKDDRIGMSNGAEDAGQPSSSSSSSSSSFNRDAGVGGDLGDGEVGDAEWDGVPADPPPIFRETYEGKAGGVKVNPVAAKAAPWELKGWNAKSSQKRRRRRKSRIKGKGFEESMEEEEVDENGAKSIQQWSQPSTPEEISRFRLKKQGVKEAPFNREVIPLAIDTKALENRVVADSQIKETPRSLQIPKKIWTYWDDANPPELAQECIMGWKRYNPTFNITLITNQTVQKHILTPPPHNFAEMDVRFKADWVRLAVLMERGGFWLDSSVILTGSLDEILARQHGNRSEAFGYFLKRFTTIPTRPVFESWFIATIPHGRWITAWFNEFNKVFSNFNMEDTYLDSLKRMYGLKTYRRILQRNKMPGYLKIHMASQKVLEVDGVPVPYGEAAEKVPYRLLARLDWNGTVYAKALLEPFADPEGVPLVFKLREEERKALVELLSNPKTRISPKSIYGRFVNSRRNRGRLLPASWGIGGKGKKGTMPASAKKPSVKKKARKTIMQRIFGFRLFGRSKERG
ncbi:hypothetical protein HDU67_002346 [Dinochytrium kinnereticum]|nr:hypothetical protein HDU67_002346 [Dinochytrium kinnereticum]